MPCDSTTLEALTHVDGLEKLSDRDILMCLASVYGTRAGFTTAQLALNNAYAMGMPKLSDADLEKAWLVAIC
jgi:hypothetical protein